MSIFGWDYPPGCSGTPFDDIVLCEICGGDPDSKEPDYKCVCPECPVCGEIGRKECYVEHELQNTEEQLKRIEAMPRDFSKTELQMMTLSDAKTELQNRIYVATSFIEDLEFCKVNKIRGNGHHIRQQICEFAANLLEERWEDPN
jgi:hypothetical protein